MESTSVNGDERIRLLAVVEVDGVVPQLSKDVDDTEMVWPHLVVWEYIAAIVFVLALLITSWVVNAPLVDHANPSVTPNPAKAPWYFLNLQELLVHMHPSLAGVFVPGIFLVILAAIPFIDSSPEGVGRYFGSAKGVMIAIFSSAYATLLVAVMIVFNEFVGVRRVLDPLGVPTVIIEILIPIAILIGLPILQIGLVRRIWRPVTTQELVIAFFFGFVATYLVLTVVGTAFRGPGMHLVWPWELTHGAA